jgi:hypothetical protein
VEFVDSQAMHVPDLDELYCGKLYLSVPLLHDIIQVGVGGAVTTGMIEVWRTPTAVTVRRVDGKPLQAQILREQSGPDGRSVREEVFSEPRDCLRLQRTGGADGPSLWLVSDGVDVEPSRDLRQFVTTIATFGLAKQRRSRDALPPKARLFSMCWVAATGSAVPNSFTCRSVTSRPCGSA